MLPCIIGMVITLSSTSLMPGETLHIEFTIYSDSSCVEDIRLSIPTLGIDMMQKIEILPSGSKTHWFIPISNNELPGIHRLTYYENGTISAQRDIQIRGKVYKTYIPMATKEA